MIKVQFSASPENWADYSSLLKRKFEAVRLDVDLRQYHQPSEVDYIIYAPNSDLEDFSGFTKCKAVLSLWAGVETIVQNESLTMPLCRMVDAGLTAGMVEWVVGHSLRYHLNIDHNITSQSGVWDPQPAPLASERPVTILGLGQLGQICAKTLQALGFPVTGWSRSPKFGHSFTCLHGEDGLYQALSSAQILILLLPDTAQTNNLLDSRRMAWLPRGARIINAGRGTLIEDPSLVKFLDEGHIAHATLDVFRTEPLPAELHYPRSVFV